MRKTKPRPNPKYNIGNIVGSIARANQWGNEWYEDGSKIVKIEFEYGYIPYTSSGTWRPEPQQQFMYVLEDGRRLGEHSITPLDGSLFYSPSKRF